MKFNIKRVLTAMFAVAMLSSLTGCMNDTTSTAADTERASQGTQQDMYNRIQPLPIFNVPSQQRETGFTVQRAQVTGPATTTFVMKAGNVDPTFVCASIGYPLAASTEASNPQQIVSSGNNQSQVIAAMDPNGTYPIGTTTGTYVSCLQDDGTVRIDYHETDVETYGASATWDYTLHRVTITGHATVTVKKLNK